MESRFPSGYPVDGIGVDNSVDDIVVPIFIGVAVR
jgi:hypothetical protein